MGGSIPRQAVDANQQLRLVRERKAPRGAVFGLYVALARDVEHASERHALARPRLFRVEV